MSAFNKRITIAKVGSIVPLKSLIFWVTGILGALIAFVVPLWAKILLVPLVILAFIIGLGFFLLGKKILFINIPIANLIERRKKSIDLCQLH